MYPISNSHEIPDGKKIINNLRKEIRMRDGFKKGVVKSIEMTKLSKLLSKIINNGCKLRYHHIQFICDTINNNIIPIEEMGSSGKKLHYMNTNDLFLEKVKSITHSKSQMYDLSVPNTHTFISNGIVSHNCQGITLDYAIMDLSNVFTWGQAYIGLSRVKTIEGLSLKDIRYEAIQAHPLVVQYYKDLEENKY